MNKESHGKVEIVPETERVLFRFQGELDSASCKTWSDRVLTQIGETALPVVFDLADVAFVGSPFLSLCIQAQEKLGAARLTLVNLTPPVKKVFVVSGLEPHFRIA